MTLIKPEAIIYSSDNASQENDNDSDNNNNIRAINRFNWLFAYTLQFLLCKILLYKVLLKMGISIQPPHFMLEIVKINKVFGAVKLVLESILDGLLYFHKVLKIVDGGFVNAFLNQSR